MSRGRGVSPPGRGAGDLTTVGLGPGDAAAGFALSAEAGWNQTVADWRLMLAQGEAIGQRGAGGRLVASALVLPYGGRVGWIGMVLTSADHRRLGLATRNLHWAIERCHALGLIAGLDATPAGRAVYRPLGFVDAWGLVRLAAAAPVVHDPAAAAIAAPEIAVRSLRDPDLPAVIAHDAKAFGAARPHLLAHLVTDHPNAALVAEVGGTIRGFVLARRGRIALHLGPLTAGRPEIAMALAARALASVDGPVSIDVPEAQPTLRAWLTACGFAPVRPFTRMLRESPGPLGMSERCFAISGPEFG